MASIDPARIQRVIIERAAQHAIEALLVAATRQIVFGAGKAYVRGMQEAARRAQGYADAYLPPNDAYRKEHFFQLGKIAQQSMLASYGQRVSRNKTVPSYRFGSGRLSGGVLRRALGSSAFFTATPDGLEWGNIAFLDSTARHWHRINFGAGTRGEGTDAEFPVTFEGLNTAIGLVEGPSPAFSMPPGFWLGPGGKRVPAGTRGSAAFYPVSGNTLQSALGKAGARSISRGRPEGWRPTQGIEAANFMDAGMRRIAAGLPDLYKAFKDDMEERMLKNREAGRQSVSITQGPVLGTGGGIISKFSL